MGAALAGLEEARAHVEDALVSRARPARARRRSIPERIEEIDGRLDALTKLRRKYGESVAAIWRHRQEVAAALERLDRHEALTAELEAEVVQLAGAARAEALELSGVRATAAERLGAPRPAGAARARHGARAVSRSRCGGRRRATTTSRRTRRTGASGPRGVETVEFLLSANPGEDPRPLARVASGGELSRTMLGFKTILAAAADVPTMIFDEVDAGIGGRVADVVGQKLRETAAGRQVLCVTHLAPIAAHADHHLRGREAHGPRRAPAPG